MGGGGHGGGGGLRFACGPKWVRFVCAQCVGCTNKQQLCASQRPPPKPAKPPEHTQPLSPPSPPTLLQRYLPSATTSKRQQPTQAACWSAEFQPLMLRGRCEEPPSAPQLLPLPAAVARRRCCCCRARQQALLMLLLLLSSLVVVLVSLVLSCCLLRYRGLLAAAGAVVVPPGRLKTP